MIALAGLIVMLLVEHLAVIVTTGHVLLIVTRALHALQRKNVQMKLKAALVNVAQVAKCLCLPSVLVKIG
jgi:hypothetical protein